MGKGDNMTVMVIRRLVCALPKVMRDWIIYLRFDPKRFWTEKGSTYFVDYHTAEERNEQMILKILEKIGFDSLIDIGCGYGRYLKCIHEHFPHAKLVGVDISPTQISSARAFLAHYPEIELREIDGSSSAL